MTTEFRIARHAIRDAGLIEIFIDNVFVGAVYPTDEGVRIVSKYLDNLDGGVVFDATTPPAVEIRLRPMQ